jgi:hypothetical protein
LSNSTYVCFDCQTTERVPAGRITRNCRKCRAQAEHVYYRFKIPQRDDSVAWQSLQTKVRAFNRQAKSNVLARLRQERERLERQIAELPKNKPGRQRMLSFKLKVVDEKIEKWSLW